MAVRHLLLAIGALVVLGLVVFLFLEVRSSPASPIARPVAHNTTADDEPADAAAKISTVAETGRTPRPNIGGRPVKHVGSDDEEHTPGGGDPRPPQTADTVKLDDVMAEANKAYDRMEFDEARTFARKVLDQQPNNARMLRIMVSAACVEVDAPEAQKHYNLLGKVDRDQMKTRCARYGVTFTEPPAK